MEIGNLSWMNMNTVLPKTEPQAIDKSASKIRTGDKRLLAVCQDFEALFIKQMLNAMRKTVDKSGLLNGGMAEEVFEDMLYDEYAKAMSKTDSIGIARLLYDQLSEVDK